MSKEVCALASWEVDEFTKNSRLPDCGQHKHVKIAEAKDMTAGSGLYTRKVAEWVGPGERRIAMLTKFDYRPRTTATGHVVYNRIEC